MAVIAARTISTIRSGVNQASFSECRGNTLMISLAPPLDRQIVPKCLEREEFGGGRQPLSRAGVQPQEMGEIRIGISGWRYAPWRGVFYPPDLPQYRELEFASRALPSIEINGSFYSLQRPESWASWYRATPRGFVFSVKAPRYITHIRRLREIE